MFRSKVFRTAVASVCLLVSAQGASTPRPVADVPISVADGKPIKLSQYRGKVMVVALISTTCVHCIASLQMLSKFQKEFAPQGFQALGIAADDSAATGVVGLARNAATANAPMITISAAPPAARLRAGRRKRAPWNPTPRQRGGAAVIVDPRERPAPGPPLPAARLPG